MAALLSSFVGAAVQASAMGSWGWWGGHMGDHMFDSGHVIWWGDDRSVADPIDGARELVVTATDFSFTPAKLTLTAGEPVNLTLDNQGRLPHDLVIPELGVKVTANPGRQATTGIVVGEPGTFGIVCTFSGHATAGMTGELEVLDN